MTEPDETLRAQIDQIIGDYLVYTNTLGKSPDEGRKATIEYNLPNMRQLLEEHTRATLKRVEDALPEKIDIDAPMLGYKGDEVGYTRLESWREGRNVVIEACKATIQQEMEKLDDQKG